MRVTLVDGVNFGMTMVAATPASCACRATAWAWLPADMAMTPRAAFVGAEQGQPVCRAAFLEGAGDLQVVELQRDAGAGGARYGVAGHGGRAQHAPGDAAGGRLDVGEVDHRGAG